MCFYVYYNLFSSFPRLLFWANLSTHRGLHDPSTDCWVCYESNCNSEPGFPSHLAAKMKCCWLNDHWFSWKQSYTNSNSQLCHHLWGFVAWALRHLAEIFMQSRIALTEALRSHLESRLSDSMGWPSSLWTAHVPLVLQLGFCFFFCHSFWWGDKMWEKQSLKKEVSLAGIAWQNSSSLCTKGNV